MVSDAIHTAPAKYPEDPEAAPPRALSFRGRDVLASLALVVGVVAFLAGDGLLHEDAYVEIGYALALLSAIGSVACLGYLFLVFRGLDIGFEVSFAQRLFAGTTSSMSERGERWPLLVKLLFSPFAMLFSGLAGWVEARG